MGNEVIANLVLILCIQNKIIKLYRYKYLINKTIYYTYFISISNS
jgi:hypothetical protein